MTRIHPLRTALMLLLAIALGLALTQLYHVGYAHADPAPGLVTGGDVHALAVATPAPASSGLPWQAWIAIGIAAIAGLETVVRGLRALVGLIAPRTETTVDDSIRDWLDRADDALLELQRAVRGVARPSPPATTPVTMPIPMPIPRGPRGPQSGQVSPILLALLALGAVVLCLVAGCASPDSPYRARCFFYAPASPTNLCK